MDAALLAEVTRTYVDLDATRRALEARLASDRALAADALAQAEREASAAAERFQRVQRAFQDGVIEPADWADQRPGLIAEREAADAELGRVRGHTEALARAVPDVDAEAELLRHLVDLRAAVVDGIGKAPNLDATRTLLRRLFKRLLYLAPGHPWLEMPGFTADMPEAARGYLLLDLNPSVIEGIHVDGTLQFERAALPVEQPLREGLPMALVVGGLGATIDLPKPPPPPTTTTCRICERDLPFSAFNMNRGVPRTECLECERERRRERYAATRRGSK